MAMTLTNDRNEQFQFSNIGWCYYLNLAARYGWDGAKTQAPKDWNPDLEWQGDYDTSQGQYVTLLDAAEMCGSLETYLLDPEGAVEAQALATELSKLLDREIVPDDNSKFVQAFIRFATDSGFTIR